jgi:hypothetical protein
MGIQLIANVRALISKWIDKRAQLRPVAMIGADEIASRANALIPQYFPGKVAKTITVEPFAGGGASLAQVRGVATSPLFRYYTKGTRPHRIDATNVRALSFDWGRVGAHVILDHVNHPGTHPHEDALNEFMTQFREIAHDQWTLSLRELLQS